MLDVPPPPWEAQRPPGVEMSYFCMPAALVHLCCRALDYRHVYMVLNGPQLAALPCILAAFLFSRLDSVLTPLEVGPFHLLPGYPAGIPGRTLLVERVGSDLNTRGYFDPADNDATGTRVPARFEGPWFHVLPHL